MLAALLFACQACLSHDPLYSAPRYAQDAFALYRAGGTSILRTLKTAPPGSDASGSIYDGSGPVTALDLDGPLLYFAEGNSLRVITGSGGAPAVIAQANGPVVMISHDADAIYWVETTGFILRLNKRTGVIDTVAGGLTIRLDPDNPDQSVAFDETSIYTTAIGNGLWRIDKATQMRTLLLAPLDHRYSVFVDGSWVYVANLFLPKSGGIPQVLPDSHKGDEILALAGGRMMMASGPFPGYKGVPTRSYFMTGCQGGALFTISILFPTNLAIDTCTVYGASPATRPCFTVSSYITKVDPLVLPSAGGAMLTVTGSGFEPDVAVSVGGVAATVLTVSPDRVIALSPPAPRGPAWVTVENAQQCARAAITIDPPPRRTAVSH